MIISGVCENMCACFGVQKLFVKSPVHFNYLVAVLVRQTHTNQICKSSFSMSEVLSCFAIYGRTLSFISKTFCFQNALIYTVICVVADVSDRHFVCEIVSVIRRTCLVGFFFIVSCRGG